MEGSREWEGFVNEYEEEHCRIMRNNEDLNRNETMEEREIFLSTIFLLF